MIRDFICESNLVIWKRNKFTLFSYEFHDSIWCKTCFSMIRDFICESNLVILKKNKFSLFSYEFHDSIWCKTCFSIIRDFICQSTIVESYLITHPFLLACFSYSVSIINIVHCFFLLKNKAIKTVLHQYSKLGISTYLLISKLIFKILILSGIEIRSPALMERRNFINL